MKTPIYSIKDVAAGHYQSLIRMDSDVSARRSIVEAIEKNPELPISKYRYDFEMHHIGDFDSETGIVTQPSSGPRVVFKISELEIKNEKK